MARIPVHVAYSLEKCLCVPSVPGRMETETVTPAGKAVAYNLQVSVVVQGVLPGIDNPVFLKVHVFHVSSSHSS